MIQVFGAGEAIAITALSGVVGKMTKKREEMYAAGSMGAVQGETSASTTGGNDADISIPYDATAQLAYQQAGSKGDFEAFKAQYLKDAIALVVAKKVAREGGVPAPVAAAAVETSAAVVDISIPYDATAQLAYTSAGSPGDFETFKAQYLKDAIAMVVAKKVAREGGAPAPVAAAAVETSAAVVDISIPYDAPAQLAYTTAGSPGDFEAFKTQYLKDAIAMVVAKKVAREGGAPAPAAAAVAADVVDISIPYDAPAQLAYTSAGSPGDFEAFKAQYLKDAIALVVAKKVAREGGAPAPAAAADVVDISIPYDAPAQLAYTTAGSPGDFETFKAQYLSSTIDMIKAKRAAVLAN